MILRPKKIKQYLWRIRKARYKRGFTIHSPFVFNLVTKILNEKSLYYSYKEIESNRDKLFSAILQTYHSTYKKTMKQYKEGVHRSRFLFRLINHLAPQTVLEIGSTLGIDTLYMATPYPQTRCITIESDKVMAGLSTIAFEQMGSSNIEVINEEWISGIKQVIDRNTMLDFICFNQVIPNFETAYELCRSRMTEKSCFVIRNIRKNKESLSSWNRIKHDPTVVISIDMYSMGLLFYDPTLTPKHYKLYF